MGFTVTVTSDEASDGALLTLKVLTGAASGGTGGAVTGGHGTAHAQTWTLTPSFSKSLIVTGFVNDNELTTVTGATGNTVWNQDHSAQATVAASWYSGTVTSGTQVTLGLTNATTVNNENVWATAEIPPAGSTTPAVDSSSPAAVTSADGLTLVTASFTPPSGSLLCAVAAFDTGAGGSPTLSVSDTSGQGLTWTALETEAYPTFHCTCQVWVAQIASGSGTTVSDSDASGPEADAGEQAGIRPVSPDASAAADAGEKLLIQSAWTPLAPSPAYRLRYPARRLPFPAQRGNTFADRDSGSADDEAAASFRITAAAAETAAGADGTETIAVTGAETCAAAETAAIAAADSETSSAAMDNGTIGVIALDDGVGTALDAAEVLTYAYAAGILIVPAV